MKVTFKQYSSLADLTEDQVTEERLEEIFGAFFGNKSPAEKTAATAAIRDKKASLQTTLKGKEAGMARNKAGLSSNEEDWRKWIHSEKNPVKSGISTGSRMDKLPSARHTASMARAGERDWVKSLKKEGFQFDHVNGLKIKEANKLVLYKGYSINKKEGGNYHVTKGPQFIGHAKDHQEAIKVADKHMAKNEGLEEKTIIGKNPTRAQKDAFLNRWHPEMHEVMYKGDTHKLVPKTQVAIHKADGWKVRSSVKNFFS